MACFFFCLTPSVFPTLFLFSQHFPAHILDLLCKFSFIMIEFSGQTAVRMVYGQSRCVQGSKCVLLLCVYRQFGHRRAVSARVSQSCCGLTRSLGRDAFSLV